MPFKVISTAVRLLNVMTVTTSKSILLSKQEVPVLRGLGWTCSRPVRNILTECVSFWLEMFKTLRTFGLRHQVSLL